jgi:NO-binding membrane sensor protein with MHYT domain
MPMGQRRHHSSRQLRRVRKRQRAVVMLIGLGAIICIAAAYGAMHLADRLDEAREMGAAVEP